MDFVARAKALISNKGAVGLAIVSLAAAVPAFGQGVSTLPAGNLNCVATSFAGSSGACSSGSMASQLGTLNGIAGVKFFGPSSGSYSFSDFTPGSNTASLAFSTSGTLSGPSISGETIIPLLYDFNINGGSNPSEEPSVGSELTGSFTSWELQYQIFDNSISAGMADVFSPASNFTGLQSGSANLTLTNTLATADPISVDVTLFMTATDGEKVTVSIPSSSFDVNNTSAPEPATEALAGLSIALAGGYLLVRRRKGFVPVKDQAKS